MRILERELKSKLKHMKERCNIESRHNYYLYGGKGIIVCDEWNNSFDKFYDWAIKTGYSIGLTIDRIDSDKNYCPDNCRWYTVKEQNINRKSTIIITHNNVTQPLSYWAKELNIPRQTIKARMDRGLSFKDSIK
jgi:hypothetical protein